MKLGPKALVPAAVLVGALAASAALVVARPIPVATPREEPLPVVAVVRVAPGPARMRVRSQGTIEPRTENELVAEVAGRLVWVSPALESGSFFEAEEVLARIETAEYEIARERAKAALARARSQRRLAEASLQRSRALRTAGAVSAAAFDQVEGQAAVAAANELEARAALRQAELELSRTEVRAPFAGRVRTKTADVGQLVARGAPLASVFAVDWAEVRLPVRSEELAMLDLPLVPDPEGGATPRVQLRGPSSGHRYTWEGRVVRAEGTLDPGTRLAHVVARVADPYGLESDAPPLSVGLFVEAEILGPELEDVVALPRSALRGTDVVTLVDAEERLVSRTVELLHLDGETAFVLAGLAPGERVAVRPPSAFVEGMAVRVGEALLPAGKAPRPAREARVSADTP
jgi:RND family efflux transporter MFP subunit